MSAAAAAARICHYCHKQNIKLYKCSKCKNDTYRVCSTSCQKKDYKRHKQTCLVASSSSSSSSSIQYCEEEQQQSNHDGIQARLEVLQSKEGGEEEEKEVWKDAGPIHLTPSMMHDLDSNSANSSNNNTIASIPTTRKLLKQKVQSTLQKSLPKCTRQLLQGSFISTSSNNNKNSNYTYQHSNDKIDTNVLLLFHGAGDSHDPYSTFANTMSLPQTATLSLHASSCGNDDEGFVTLPFGLGHTWFEEMDYVISGDVLPKHDGRRLTSLTRASRLVRKIISSLLPKEGEEGGWSPECIFLFGYSAGACLVMEVCRTLAHHSIYTLGGAICVAGGIQHESKTSTYCTTPKPLTPILIMTGAQDEIYPPGAAIQSSKLYNNNNNTSSSKKNNVVTIYNQPNKRHEMICKKEEVQAMMEFLSKLLVRRFVAMEDMCT
uniref:MYND-type domain-containing protein n=1 Tax=Ditylum brightwellii TaxID=49249 RepID=A0A6U3UIX6_9STRA|mmetsp:Transcript_5219/g.7953  ORF Transcript_5219/g.7953 Transcript_5219/m.7953 type:complete len:433 (+) Transcript_5219:125-1423(+)